MNGRNDGTSFEPCVAYVSAEIGELGAAPATIRDAAISDSPNYRGCHWRSPDDTTTFSQIVGDEPDLATYKSKHSHRPWQTDRTIHGRTVAVAAEVDGCIAVFESVDAVVISGVNVTSRAEPSPKSVAECDAAVAWATLAATKAP